MGMFRKRPSGASVHQPSGFRRRLSSGGHPLTAPVQGNPNPNNWQIVKYEEIKPYLIVLLRYPDCTNYEGNKILMFENLTLLELFNQRMIDPHFFKDSKYKSPIARFEPTERGWQLARKLARS